MPCMLGKCKPDVLRAYQMSIKLVRHVMCTSDKHHAHQMCSEHIRQCDNFDRCAFMYLGEIRLCEKFRNKALCMPNMHIQGQYRMCTPTEVRVYIHPFKMHFCRLGSSVHIHTCYSTPFKLHLLRVGCHVCNHICYGALIPIKIHFSSL